MKSKAVNLIELLDQPNPDWIVFFTSNTGLKKNGCNVMGAGTAAVVKKAVPGIDCAYGLWLKEAGPEEVFTYTRPGKVTIGAFPVKPSRVKVLPGKENIVEHMKDQVTEGGDAMGFMSKAKPSMILDSWLALNKYIIGDYSEIFVPQWPGSGNGELTPDESKAIVPKHMRDIPITLYYKK